jgi:hypothetical protein
MVGVQAAEESSGKISSLQEASFALLEREEQRPQARKVMSLAALYFHARFALQQEI